MKCRLILTSESLILHKKIDFFLGVCRKLKRRHALKVQFLSASFNNALSYWDYIATVTDEYTSTEYWWNNTQRGKQNSMLFISVHTFSIAK
jgi:hypothetical protein